MKNAITHLNWPIVLAAAVAYYAVGAIWYTVLFGKYWARVNNVVPGNRSGMVKAMVIGFLLTIVICATIDLVLYVAGGHEWTTYFARTYLLVAGLIIGFLGMQLNYGMKPFGIWLVDIGYQLAGSFVACLILARWGMISMNA